jgi:hypothetical protein
LRLLDNAYQLERLGWGGWISLRFQGYSRAYLAPQHQSTRTCTIEFAAAAGLNSTPELLRRLEVEARAHGGIQHWGMFNDLTVADVERAYPKIDTFRRIRWEITNGGTNHTFDNDFTIRCGLASPPRPAASQWTWLDMNKPETANIRAPMGAVTVMDTPTSPQRPHVFVEGDDFNLWCRWYSGTEWSWLNMGKPDTANIVGLAGAVTLMDTPASAQSANVFVTGNDGNLWCHSTSGTEWYWTNMGKPQTANISGPLGTVTVMDTPTSTQRPHVFVRGNDGNLWVDWRG